MHLHGFKFVKPCEQATWHRRDAVVVKKSKHQIRHHKFDLMLCMTHIEVSLPSPEKASSEIDVMLLFWSTLRNKHVCTSHLINRRTHKYVTLPSPVNAPLGIDVILCLVKSLDSEVVWWACEGSISDCKTHRDVSFPRPENAPLAIDVMLLLYRRLIKNVSFALAAAVAAKSAKNTNRDVKLPSPENASLGINVIALL